MANETLDLLDEIATGYVLDEEGNKILAHSHIDIVRYNADKTLKDKLAEINEFMENISEKIKLSAQTICDALGYVPVNSANATNFQKTVSVKESLTVGVEGATYATVFKPLYADDGVTQIGHILE